MPLLDDCKILLKKFHRLIIYYIFREANECVDILTKFKVIIFSDYVNFVNPILESLPLLTRSNFLIINLLIINLYFNVGLPKKKKNMMRYGTT